MTSVRNLMMRVVSSARDIQVDLKYIRSICLDDMPTSYRLPALFIIATMWVPMMCETFLAGLRWEIQNELLARHEPSASARYGQSIVEEHIVSACHRAARHEHQLRAAGAHHDFSEDHNRQVERLHSEYAEMRGHGTAYHWGPARCLTRLGLCRKAHVESDAKQAGRFCQILVV